MTITLYSDVGAFSRVVRSFLEPNEAENNLILGIMNTLLDREVTQAAQGPSSCVLAAITAGSEVVGAAVMTPPHRLVLSNMPADAARELCDHLIEQGVAIHGINASQAVAEWFAHRYGARCHATTTCTRSMHIHRLQRVASEIAVPGSMRLATTTDAVLLQDWSERFAFELHSHVGEPVTSAIAQERVWVWELPSGVTVSTASCTGRTAHGIRIARVFTPLEHRKFGYASALVAAVSQRQLLQGYDYCFLNTDDAMPWTAALYAAIGYIPVSSSQEWDFSVVSGE